MCKNPKKNLASLVFFNQTPYVIYERLRETSTVKHLFGWGTGMNQNFRSLPLLLTKFHQILKLSENSFSLQVSHPYLQSSDKFPAFDLNKHKNIIVNAQDFHTNSLLSFSPFHCRHFFSELFHARQSVLGQSFIIAIEPSGQPTGILLKIPCSRCLCLHFPSTFIAFPPFSHVLSIHDLRF